MATATARDNAGGSSASVQIHKHCARLEKLVPEDWKEWQYQFGVATHAYSSKHGALLEIMERMEIDEVSNETLKNKMRQEESEWMGRTQSETFSMLGQPVGEELRRQEWLHRVEEALRQVQPEDAGES